MGRTVFEQSGTVRKNWERLGGAGIDQSDKEEDGKVMNHLQSMLIGIIPSAGISSDERMDDQKHIRMDCQIKTTKASIAHTALSVPLLYRFLIDFGFLIGDTFGSLSNILCDFRCPKVGLDCRHDS